MLFVFDVYSLFANDAGVVQIAQSRQKRF